MITIALVDDHTIVRSGFAQLLNLEQDIRVQGEYESAKAAFHALTQAEVDVAIIDISMPDENGLSLLERLRQHNPRFKAIILSIYDSASFVKKSLGCWSTRLPIQTMWSKRASECDSYRCLWQTLFVRRCLGQFE